MNSTDSTSFALQRRAVSPLALALLPLLLAAAMPSAHAQDGSLDPTFSADGKVIFGFAGAEDQARGVAVQPDGKIVVAGYAFAADNTSSAFVVLRYDADGSLDSTFGAGGIVTTQCGTYCEANAVALQPDGKIVVAGEARESGTRDIAVVRYNPDGSLDLAFGVGGIVITELGGYERANAVALQPDGKIVVAGVSNAVGGGIGDFATVRYNADGSLDLTFDTDGSVITSVGGDYSVAQAVALQSDGKIVVAGYNHRPSNIVFNGFFDLEVVRYNADGSLDPTFDTDGVVIYATGDLYSLGSAVAVQTDGKIVVAGRVAAFWGVIRYNADGSLDPTFDTDGIAPYPFGGNLAFANALALQPDGKIDVAGFYLPDANSNATDFAVVRYTADGALDPDFGSGGSVTTNFGGYQDAANAIALQPDGKMVVAGSTRNSTTFLNDFALARYINTVGSPPDSDGDGVPDSLDVCPGTVLPEDMPAYLKRNRYYANRDGNFVDVDDVWSGITVADTGGCSGIQIIERAGLGSGHVRFGITRSALLDWIASLP